MPYTETRKNNHAVLWAVLAVVTLLAIAVAGLYVWNVYQEEQATRSRLIEEATPRIVVPSGYFEAAAPGDQTAPKGVAAIRVTPGVDFYKKAGADEAAVAAEVDAMLAQIQKLGMNTVLVDTLRDGQVIYKSAALPAASVDALGLIARKADELGIRVGVVFHAFGVESEDSSSPLSAVSRDKLAAAAGELATYNIAFLQVEDYYVERDGSNYREFVRYGAPGDYGEWLNTSVQALFGGIADAARKAKPSMPVGIGVSSVWANKDTNPEGSATAAEFQELRDGNIDTRALVQKKLVDFVDVSIPYSRADKSVPFQTSLEWWNTLCEAEGTPLYVSHAGENACTEKTGWSGMDELARQVSVANEFGGYAGSVFSGLSRLMEDTEGSTAYLTEYLAGQVSDTDLFTNLSVSVPEKPKFVVYEEEQQFRMQFDPNQEVLLNGEKVEPTARGGASVWVPLKVGENTVLLTHKGETMSYEIERRVVIFDSVSPTKSMKVAGDTKLELSAKAYKGATVTAQVGGATVALTEGGGEGDVPDSQYVNFTGSFTAPKAAAKEQPLGTVVFNGSFEGYSATEKGAAITVDKRLDEVDPDEMTDMSFPHIVVTDDYAFTYPYNTIPEYAEGILFELPKGTTDVAVSQNGNFLNLRSGKTVKLTTGTKDSQTEVKLVEKPFAGNNHVSAMQMGVEGNDTVIRMTMDWKAPFSIDLSPYPREPLPTKRSTYKFAADTVTILLDYATTMPEDIQGSLDGSPIFSGIPEMERVKNDIYGIWQYKLTLPLNQAGRYYGCHATWEGDDLVLRFNHPPYSNGSLEGLKIMVDPGHGGKDPGTMSGADIIEKNINLPQAEKLAEELQALGAEVVMMRTGDNDVEVYDRTRVAAADGVDLFISVHHNAALYGNPVPNGIEVYYNTPFSQGLAANVHNQVIQTMTDRGLWSKNFLVARSKQFPSILIECGYLSNPGDEMLAQDPHHQRKLAQEVAQGVLDYYAAVN